MQATDKIEAAVQATILCVLGALFAGLGLMFALNITGLLFDDVLMVSFSLSAAIASVVAVAMYRDEVENIGWRKNLAESYAAKRANY